MPVLLAALGALLVAAALYGGLKTTLSAQGGALLTSALSAALWGLLGGSPAHALSCRAAGGVILPHLVEAVGPPGSSVSLLLNCWTRA